MYRTVLVPLDGSPESETVLPHAEAIAQAFDAEVILLRVAFTHDVEGVDPRTTGEDLAQQYLAQVQRLEREKNLRSRVLVRFGDPVEAIVSCANEEQADLIVLATHGRTGLQRLLEGNVAEAVRHKTPIPLLLTRTTDE